MKQSRSLLAMVALVIVAALTMRVVSADHIGTAAPVEVGVDSPNNPSAPSNTAAGSGPFAR